MILRLKPMSNFEDRYFVKPHKDHLVDRRHLITNTKFDLILNLRNYRRGNSFKLGIF